MKYLEFHFSLRPFASDFADVLEAVLADVGFDSFVKADDLNVSASDVTDATGDTVFPDDLNVTSQTADAAQLTAYIKAADYDEMKLKQALANFPVTGVEIDFGYSEAEDKDWNAEWEKNFFQPLVVDDRCVVSATFHKDVPQAEYSIRINPRMSFGTGHHETTRQMLREILRADVAGKYVLDMGCGTSILAILAAMRGARHCTAIDVDEWCVRNSEENISLNGLQNIKVMLGDASLLPSEPFFDIILANIHLNIIVGDMPAYVSCLRSGGLLLTSGFYRKDLPRVEQRAAELGLTLLRAGDEREWCCAVFEKTAK